MSKLTIEQKVEILKNAMSKILNRLDEHERVLIQMSSNQEVNKSKKNILSPKKVWN
jgi:hypothetical protein